MTEIYVEDRAARNYRTTNATIVNQSIHQFNTQNNLKYGHKKEPCPSSDDDGRVADKTGNKKTRFYKKTRFFAINF